jgi:hypothetical protein
MAEMGDHDDDHMHDMDMSPMGILDHVRDMQDLVYYNPMKANVWYLLVCLFFVQFSLLNITRYRSKSTTYDGGKLGENATNYLQLSDQVRLFGMLGIFGIASVTQLMATLGIATGINLMVWIYLVAGLGSVLGLVVVVLRTLGYNAVWSSYDSTTKSATIQLTAKSVLFYFDQDIFQDAVQDAAITMILAYNMKDWYYAQFEGLEWDAQETMIEEYEKDVEQQKIDWAVDGAEEGEAEAEEAAEEGADDEGEEDEAAEEGAEEEEE